MVGVPTVPFPRTLLFASAALLLASACEHGGMDEAMEAAKAGDYKTAFETWESLAEDGVPAAQYDLAQLYRQGLGVKRDYTKAAAWYREAAKHFHTEARFNLALMYEKGLGVPIDYDKARKWYRLAANHGYRPAQFNLGVMYAIGEGTKRDWPQAHMWYSLAAGAGDTRAAENLRQLIARMSPEQLGRAAELMNAWQETWGKTE